MRISISYKKYIWREDQGTGLSICVLVEWLAAIPIQTVAMTMRLEQHQEVKVTDTPADSALHVSQN
jgi:hypothetical protein